MMILQQAIEKALGRLAVASCLQNHIDDLSVRINSSPQVLLLILDFHEHFVDEKCISKSLMSTLQGFDVFESKLVTPQTNRLIAYGNTAFRQQILDASVTKIEPIV